MSAEETAKKLADAGFSGCREGYTGYFDHYEVTITLDGEVTIKTTIGNIVADDDSEYPSVVVAYIKRAFK